MAIVCPGDLGRMAVDGTFVANGASNVVVPYPYITANSMVDITVKTPGGTVGATPSVKLIVPGVSFTVAATAADTSTYNFNVNG